MDGVQPWTSTFHPLYIHNGIKNLAQKNSLKYFEMSWISMRYFKIFWDVLKNLELMEKALKSFQIFLKYFSLNYIPNSA